MSEHLTHVTRLSTWFCLCVTEPISVEQAQDKIPTPKDTTKVAYKVIEVNPPVDEPCNDHTEHHGHYYAQVDVTIFLPTYFMDVEDVYKDSLNLRQEFWLSRAYAIPDCVLDWVDLTAVSIEE
jgi:hypothetical protein